MKLRLFLSVISLSLLSLKLSAQQTKTLLWQISGKELTKPSYVFGTMHVLCSAEEMMTDSLLAVLGRTEQVFFEIDMDNAGEMLGIFRFIRMKDNKRISGS